MKVRTLPDLLRENLIVKHYAGSHAYGTALPTSDVDFRGIFAADPVNIRTPFFPVYEVDDPAEEDTKFYELSKFMKLYTEGNPNIVETLWVDASDIVSSTPTYDLLRLYRQLLLSAKLAFTTTGYATAQLKRIKGHNKWITNPQPIEPPKPFEFLSVLLWSNKELRERPIVSEYLNDHRLIPYGNDIYGVFPEKGRMLWDEKGNLNDIFEGRREDIDLPLFMVKWSKEEYRQKKEKHEQYWTWKNNRNKTRAELEEDFGFDTKHAMHLVRLMRMGVEALRDGVIIVKRPDAEELLAIRNGSWSYEQLIEYAEHMDHEIRDVWYHKTILPKSPDIELAAKVLMEAQDMVWNKNNG